MKVVSVTVLASLLALSAFARSPRLAATAHHPATSKRAAKELRFIANVLSGHAVVRFRWTGEGALRRDILSAACPVPDQTPDERLLRLRSLSEEKRDSWLSYLSVLADSDGSGSVSTAEGELFARRAFTGLTAARLPDLQSADQLAQFIEEDPLQVTEDLAAYDAIQDAAERDGMHGLPALPSALKRPSNNQMQRTKPAQALVLRR